MMCQGRDCDDEQLSCIQKKIQNNDSLTTVPGGGNLRPRVFFSFVFHITENVKEMNNHRDS